MSSSRRPVLVVFLGLVVAAAAAWWLLRPGDTEVEGTTSRAASGASRWPRRANVVLLTLDTLRADRLSCYGAEIPATPHIDALAAHGVRFTNAVTTVPFTLPAHSSIMTGVYPPRHGVRENVGYVLDERRPTLAERLGDGGWTTAAFVSSFVLDSRWGIGRGFETYFDDFETEPGKAANLGAVQRDGAETVERAIEWLDASTQRSRQQPFFLWLHLYDAHDPYTPREPFKSRYPRHPYEAEVAYVDSLVGRFRDALADRGLLESSWILLTGDHGEGLGEHHEGFHGFFVYDSTVHVPLIVRPPGGSSPPRIVEEAVSHVDLLPTVLAAAGQPAVEDLDGRSLLPLVGGNATGWPEERALYTESLYPLLHYGWAPLRAVRVGQVKYIEAPRPELYELATDPGEQENVLRRHRETAADMRHRLAELRSDLESGTSAAPGRAELDDETLARLRALGYAAGRGGLSPEDEETAPRADPKDRIALHQLVMAAQSDLGSDDLDRAEERLERALASDDSILEAHEMLGRIASERGRHAEAVEHYRAALAVDDEMTSALYGLAHSYQELGRLDEALLGFRRLAQLDPDDARATLAIVDIQLASGHRAEALAELERAAGRSEPAAIVLNRFGEMLVEDGRTEEARRQFRRATEANPDLAQPYFNLAVLSEEAGSVDAAIDLYERAIERAPSHYQAQFNLGRLYGLRDEPDRQQRLYEAAIASNPDFVRGYYFLAKLLLDRGGDLERAEQLVRTGLERDEGKRAGPLGYYLLADILNRLGRGVEAERALAEGRAIEARLDAAGG